MDTLCSVPVYEYEPTFTGSHFVCSWQDGQAELTWGWLVTYQDGLHICRWSPIQVVPTRPSVD